MGVGQIIFLLSNTCDFPSQYSGLSNTYIAQVFIVLTPAYEGRLNGPSLPAFSRMGKVRSMFHVPTTLIVLANKEIIIREGISKLPILLSGSFDWGFRV